MSDRTWTRLGPPPAVFPGRRGARLARAVRDAELADAVDRRRAAVDPGRVDQHLDGAVPRVRRRPAAGAAARRPATRCRASSSASARWSRACCRGCWRKLGVSQHRRPRRGARTRCTTRSISAARCCSRAVGWTVLRTREYPPDALQRVRRRAAGRARRARAMPAAHRGADGAGVAGRRRGRRRRGRIAAAGPAAVRARRAGRRLRRRAAAAQRCAAGDSASPASCDDLHDMPHDDAAAGGGAVLLVVRAVRDVDLHDRGGDAACTTAAPTPTSAAYNEGANWVGVLFAAYNGFAALAAIVIPWMVRRWGLRIEPPGQRCRSAASACCRSLVIRDPQWLLLSMVGVGFAWASILSLPYALLSDSRAGRRRWACTWASSISSS